MATTYTSSSTSTNKPIKEYVLGTNPFKEPGSYTGAVAIAIVLTRLLLLEPGTDPMRPNMGVGIGPKYRFITEDDMDTLRDRVDDQINTYLPTSITTKCSVQMEIKPSKFLKINVYVNDQLYSYDTEDSNTPIQLSEL